MFILEVRKSSKKSENTFYEMAIYTRRSHRNFTLRITEENTGMQLSVSPIVLPCEGGPWLMFNKRWVLNSCLLCLFSIRSFVQGSAHLPTSTCFLLPGSAMPLPPRLLAYITTYPGEHGYLEECFCRAIFHQLKITKIFFQCLSNILKLKSSRKYPTWGDHHK